MTQDEIIEMAREAGFFVKDNDAYSPSVQEDHELTPFLLAFANLVAASPQRTWIGLTDVEIDYLLGSTVGENEETHISFARAIEAKLKERNT